MSGALADIYNLHDLREAARRRLPRGVYEYLERGVEDEAALDANRAAFRRVHLRPRVFTDVSSVDISTTLLGGPSTTPFAIAPTGGAGLFWYQGDLMLARAAAAAGVPFTISTNSTMDVEEIAEAGGRLWFQLYLWENRALSHAVMERAAAVGCDTLFVTADIPVPPMREYNFRNRFATPFRVTPTNAIDVLRHPRWLVGTMGKYWTSGGMPQQANLPRELKASVTGAVPERARFRNDNITWDEVKGLRDRWKGRFVIKGLLRADDAERALALGADGVVLSNHGGRSLDTAQPTLDALPGIVAAVKGRLAIYIDGGIQRGSDVVKALAMGADGVLAGRAAVYGLAAGGEAGVTKAIDILKAEIRRTMGQVGAPSIADLTPDLIA
jgi:isopentenyl diphosphate isomerase/L-lactate dehydrogenase-like FMN-dependent dehydrogenase